MLQAIGFVLLWLAGNIVAVTIAWAGVSVVDNELIEPAPAAIPEIETRRDLQSDKHDMTLHSRDRDTPPRDRRRSNQPVAPSMDEALDDHLETEAAKLGVSKASLIRDAVSPVYRGVRVRRRLHKSGIRRDAGVARSDR